MDSSRIAVWKAGEAGLTLKGSVVASEALFPFADGLIAAADAGATWVALHARTAEMYYSGNARWDAIATLVAALAPTPVLGNGDIWSADDGRGRQRTPVLGNGDIWSADDALRMIDETGCAGVVDVDAAAGMRDAALVEVLEGGEEAALKAVGLKGLAGSNPVPSGGP